MKKSFLIIILNIFLLSSSVQAKTITAEALDNFSPENPVGIFKVKTLSTQELEKGFFLDAGTIISGQIIKIQGPKRGKRDGYIELVPLLVTYRSIEIQTPEFVAKVTEYKPVNPQELVLNTGKKAVGFVFHGATQGISFVEGAAKAEEGQRLKSGLIKVYKDSPLSYIEMGKELNVNAGDILTLKIKKIR